MEVQFHAFLTSQNPVDLYWHILCRIVFIWDEEHRKWGNPSISQVPITEKSSYFSSTTIRDMVSRDVSYRNRSQLQQFPTCNLYIPISHSVCSFLTTATSSPFFHIFLTSPHFPVFTGSHNITPHSRLHSTYMLYRSQTGSFKSAHEFHPFFYSCILHELSSCYSYASVGHKIYPVLFCIRLCTIKMSLQPWSYLLPTELYRHRSLHKWTFFMAQKYYVCLVL